MNNNILKELLKEYEQKQLLNVKKLEARKKDLFSKLPRLAEIEDELNKISITTAKSIILSDNKNALQELQNKVLSLKREREEILIKNNKDPNYLSLTYDCNLCKDTGYISSNYGSKMCSCLKQKLFDIQYNKSCINALKTQTFENFNINLYSDEINEEKYGSNISPKNNIEDIKTACLDFINNIDNPDGKNLLFSGGTGLGKTYLSSAIASKLIEKGKTVLYQTSPVMLDTIISDMFNKNYGENSILESLLNVDLLIIDDLGTETMNSMKFTELYKIINTRLLNQNGKTTKTIISTNLDLQELYKAYDERLISRFIGHYDIYRFFGDDIRFKK